MPIWRFVDMNREMTLVANLPLHKSSTAFSTNLMAVFKELTSLNRSSRNKLAGRSCPEPHLCVA